MRPMSIEYVLCLKIYWGALLLLLVRPLQFTEDLLESYVNAVYALWSTSCA